MTERQNRWDVGPSSAPPAPPSQCTSVTTPAPAHAPVDVSALSEQQDFPCLFFENPAKIPHDEKVSILATMRLLPPESIVAQFGRGNCPWGPVPGAATTEATIYKSWHQSKADWNPNEHFTVSLRWVDKGRNPVPGGGYGNAHIHRNTLETIVEFARPKMLVRPPGSISYIEHGPQEDKYMPRPSGRRPPWREDPHIPTPPPMPVSSSRPPPLLPTLPLPHLLPRGPPHSAPKYMPYQHGPLSLPSFPHQPPPVGMPPQYPFPPSFPPSFPQPAPSVHPRQFTHQPAPRPPPPSRTTPGASSAPQEERSYRDPDAMTDSHTNIDDWY